MKRKKVAVALDHRHIYLHKIRIELPKGIVPIDQVWLLIKNEKAKKHAILARAKQRASFAFFEMGFDLNKQAQVRKITGSAWSLPTNSFMLSGGYKFRLQANT